MTPVRHLLGALAAFFIWASLSTPAEAFTQLGTASYYNLPHHKRADGKWFDANVMGVAHRTYDLGTHLRVTSLTTGKVVHVVVNDRGPYVKGRIIDLTPKAAHFLGLTRKSGLTQVKVSVIR